jgi:hypothetical protein
MERLPAISGWLWIRDGFALWRRQPMELSLVFMLYVALNLALAAVIPPIGSIMVLLLGPMLTTAFMSTCAQVDAGGHAHPRQLFAYFRRPVFGRLVLLGFCYVLACLLGGVIASSFAGSDLMEATMKSNSAGVAMEPAAAMKFMEALALGSGASLLLAIPLWFAAPLIAWQEMGFAKAVFFSFFSALRSYKSFVVYLLAWILIHLLVVINVAAILSVLPLSSPVVGMAALLIPCLLVLTMIRYCSYYSSYVQVFGKPAITPPG